MGEANNGDQTEVFREMYKSVIDNRIFNNLKQVLNELVDDEKSLISCDEFRKMFFTYFKGEAKASSIFDKLLAQIVVLVIGDKVFNSVAEMTQTDQLIESEKMVSVQKLSKFIDSFNFYPVDVGKIHFKNASQEMTYIMTSNTKGELSKPDTHPW